MPVMNATRRVSRWWPWLWLLATALAFAFAANPSTASGPVFQATRAGSAPIFLVGTMHSDDPRVMAMLPQVVELIGQVDTVALEIVQEPAGLAMAAAATLLPPGQDLFERAGPARRAELERAAAQRAIPLPLLARLKPWAAALVLGLPELSGRQFLDSAIQREARRLGRRLEGLESASGQLALFDTMGEPLQLALLDDAIKNLDQMSTQLEELTRVYLSGDLDSLERIGLGRYGEMDPALEHWFRGQLIELRNRRMAERMLELADQGPLLVAVGALHLPGASGLVAVLQRLGYRVEPKPIEPGPAGVSP